MLKTLLSWTEPIFFVPRLRTLKGWLWRIGWMIGIGVLAFLLLHLVGAPRSLALELQISLIMGVVLTLLPDLVLFQREVWITEKAIEWESMRVQFYFRGSFPHANTARIDFYRPGEWRFKFGGMMVHLLDGQEYIFAVPNSKKLETIATILARLDIPVTLSGWEPTTADTRTRVEDELSLAPASTRDAVFTPRPSEEPKLVTAGQQIFAALIGAGPLLLALLAMIGSWIYLWQSWGQLSDAQKWTIGIGGVGAVILSFLYLLFIGQFIEKSILIGMGLKALRSRIHSIVDSKAEEVIPVTLYNRESWTKVISKSADFGFLQVNRRNRALVFEGDKESWTIPITALTAVRIEEAEVGKEGAQSSETRYFVVIGTSRDGENWEVGLIRTRTAWGNDNAKARRERMRDLFEELRTAIKLV
jgi:hypothetical protein